MRESHQRPRKIFISGGKRLFEQHRPVADLGCAVQPGYPARREIDYPAM
jgi:hypothetical protein